MYTRDHQKYFRNLVPPLSGDLREVIVPGNDGWTAQTATWVNCAISLLASAASREPCIQLLRERRCPIIELGRCPEPLPNSSKFCYLHGNIYAANTHVGYLLYCANALGHEAAHALRKHDRLPEDLLDRLLARARWEDDAHSDELRLHDKLENYFKRLATELTLDAAPWLREIQHYRQNAITRRAYFRARGAVVRVVQLLAELAPYDTSVASPSLSQLAAYGTLLVRELLEVHPDARRLVDFQAAARTAIDGFRIPPSIPQHGQLASELTVWFNEASRFEQMENRRNDSVSFLH